MKKNGTEMSFTGWIFVGLLFISPFYDAANAEDHSPESRQRRSLMDLNAMVKAVTNHDGTDFLKYGNWCGRGGSGDPVDPIDECCQNHDICYDLATRGVCRKYGEKAVYQMEYKWVKTNAETAACEDEKDNCKSEICMCDAIITNCFKQNMNSYDEKNLQSVSLLDLLEDVNYISSE